MRITFKLFASLSVHLPPQAAGGNEIQIDVPEGATILEVIEPYQLPMKLVHLVLVNGVYVAPDDRATHRLVDGDVLAIWPPIAGG